MDHLRGTQLHPLNSLSRFRINPSHFLPGRAVTSPGLAASLHGYYYLSSSVSLFQISDSLRDLTQVVPPVDDRCYISSLHEVVHGDQVLFARFCHNHHELLACEPGHHDPFNDTSQKDDHPTVRVTRDPDVYPLWTQCPPDC